MELGTMASVAAAWAAAATVGWYLAARWRQRRREIETIIAALEAPLPAAAVTPAVQLPEVQAFLESMERDLAPPPPVWLPVQSMTFTEQSAIDTEALDATIPGLSDQTFEMNLTFPGPTELPLDTLGRDVSIEYHPPEQVEITTCGDAGRRYTPVGHARWTVRLTSPEHINGDRARVQGIEFRVGSVTVIPSYEEPPLDERGWRYAYELEAVNPEAITSEWQAEFLGALNARPQAERAATLAPGTLVTADGRPAGYSDRPIGVYLGNGRVQTHGQAIVQLGPLAGQSFEALAAAGTSTAEAMAQLGDFLHLANGGGAMSDQQRELFAARLAAHRAQHPEPPPAVRPSGRRFDLEED